MENFPLFPTQRPRAEVQEPFDVPVPDRYRAEIYRAQLEDTWVFLTDYARLHPRVTTALSGANLRDLLSKLSLYLDDYVAPSLVADFDAFQKNYRNGANADAAMLREYMNLCWEQDYDPYRPSTATAKEAGIRVGRANAVPFVSWPGISAFLDRYPMTARMLEVVARNFQKNILFCTDNVQEDWPDIEAFFFPNRQLSDLTRIRATGSDFHKGGRQTLILEFLDDQRNTQRLVFKPSDVERDFRFVGDVQAVLNNVGNINVWDGKGLVQATPPNSHGLFQLYNGLAQAANIPQVPVYKIIPVWPGSLMPIQDGQVDIRKSYGYLEFLSNDDQDKQAQDNDEVTNYYQEFGTLVALSFLYQVTDLHQENLIVHQRRPHLIDMEIDYTGIMDTPTRTGLNSAYGRFTSPDQQRRIEFVNGSIAFQPFRRDDTQNRLLPPNNFGNIPDDRTNAAMRLGFTDAMNLIQANAQAFENFLGETQDQITRLLPYGTDILITQLRSLHNIEDSGLISPKGFNTEVRKDGQNELGNWGNNFRGRIQGPPQIQNLPDLMKTYKDLAPSFAVWMDDQMIDDFLNGDVPAFYQKMSDTNILGSMGKVIPIPFGLAIMKANAASRRQISADLVNFWNTAQPLLPETYFPETVNTTQTNYLHTILNNAPTFAQILAAAIQALRAW